MINDQEQANFHVNLDIWPTESLRHDLEDNDINNQSRDYSNHELKQYTVRSLKTPQFDIDCEEDISDLSIDFHDIMGLPMMNFEN